MAGKIFINYRRGDDPGHTGRLFDRLLDVFERERLFLDVDDIAPGVDFIRVLDERLTECDVVLAVIGKGWIDARDATGARRLDDPHDFVRIEIAAALSQGKRVIPVLVGEAQMPRPDELPESLRPLARRNAVRLTHEQFHADVQGLIKAIQQALEEVKARQQTQEEAVRSAQAEEERRREEGTAVERARLRRAAMELIILAGVAVTITWQWSTITRIYQSFIQTSPPSQTTRKAPPVPTNAGPYQSSTQAWLGGLATGRAPFVTLTTRPASEEAWESNGAKVNGAWTPMSPSALAASPPPSLTRSSPTQTPTPQQPFVPGPGFNGRWGGLQ